MFTTIGFLDMPTLSLTLNGRVAKMRKLCCLLFFLFTIVIFTSCQENISNDHHANDSISNISDQESETFDTELYINYQEAYQNVIVELQKKQEEFIPSQWEYERGCLYDLNGDNQDELMYVYVGGSDTLYCSVWTFDNGKQILLIDAELASLAGAGTGGFNLVEYEGTQYICGWASNSEPWPPDTNMYYDCFLWEYPTADSNLEFSLKLPSHTFNFRYFWMENGDINPDAFSLVQDGRIALPIEKLKELKDILLDNPIQTLCEANIYNGKGLSFDKMLSSLQS